MAAEQYALNIGWGWPLMGQGFYISSLLLLSAARAGEPTAVAKDIDAGWIGKIDSISRIRTSWIGCAQWRHSCAVAGCEL
jgi:hypothetical protein